MHDSKTMRDETTNRCTMITTTSYGSWLPGDARGYVQSGEILPAAPRLAAHARSLLQSEPVTFFCDRTSGSLQSVGFGGL
ncbi:MAG: hypothetical protein GXP24_09115 [Planctomycetes bacterium]|nr:hypothetical protein [Planctomycetota bacterium]